MPVYVDAARIPFRRMIMSHMVADTLEELHEMADRLGLKRQWFQPGPPAHAVAHYDLCDSFRTRALTLGATEISRRELGEFIRRSRAAIARGSEPSKPMTTTLYVTRSED